MSKVWLTGDAVVDLIPESTETYLKCPGGAPANVAVGIARLDGQCGFFGRVGNDPFGRFMQSVLNQENIDTRFLTLDELHRTSTVLVDLDGDGERTFTFMVKPSADQFTQPEDIPAFTKGEWLHFCSIALANEPSRGTTLAAVQAMKNAGGFVSFDPNLREEVWAEPEEIRNVVMQAVANTDVVKFSEEELLFLTETDTLDAGIASLRELNIPLVLITLGKQGSLAIFNGTQHHVGVTEAQVVDTTGAGDAFVSGLLAKLSQHKNWQDQTTILQAVMWGNHCGALATTRKGAMTALPNKNQLLASLE
ncbi:aminoimidazole riboside kinase [Vibrio japonicus]|uniref:Aminoimidazole riboside kinase n=1 Tax=Vibrio japonicus TaxID=1824638 RepID=A0ABY5LLT0_9VIBR|nr:aminoimidazole riboside kinase [Vibrio japonicus]UUM31860.1 aminoimidazole riboside kinase [Vibrio japonicus]